MGYTIQGTFTATDQGYETVDVQIQDDRIVAIAPHLDPVGTIISGHNKLLLPGFVNAHTHSPEMWQRGLIPPLPLELWLTRLYDAKPLEPQQIYLSALQTALETLLSGGTSVVDHLILIPGQEAESIAAAVLAYQEIGIRAFVAPLIHDEILSAGLPSGACKRNLNPPLPNSAIALHLLQDAIERFHRPEQGITLMIAPTGIQLCSNALLEGCLSLSNRYHLGLHTHLLETRAQKLLAQEKYGCSAVEFLKQLGFLTPQTSLAHCVWLDDSDIELLAATQATVVHNPLSNLRLGSGIAPILKYRQAGVNVAFGCDGSASNDAQDLLEVIKIGSILHNTTDLDYHHWITPRQAIEMAALGGARGLGREADLGSLTTGKKADLVLYDLTALPMLPRTDPIGLLVLGRPTQAVHSVWVNGKQVIAAGQVTTVDMQRLQQELWHYSQWPPQNSAKPIDLESHYRSVMGLSHC